MGRHKGPLGTAASSLTPSTLHQQGQLWDLQQKCAWGDGGLSGWLD